MTDFFWQIGGFVLLLTLWLAIRVEFIYWKYIQEADPDDKNEVTIFIDNDRRFRFCMQPEGVSVVIKKKNQKGEWIKLPQRNEMEKG